MAKEGSTVSGLMDSFATAISISLQHGVPLRVLCDKFAHTRFEPSGWTGNPEIGYAKSIMDYIFRWIQMRFLSGHQLDLFTGMGAATTIPVGGTVDAPNNTVSLAASSADAQQQAATPALSDQDLFNNGGTEEGHIHEREERTPPQHGIAPEPTAESSASHNAAESTASYQAEDRGLYHASDAMKSMYDMGDAPSCATCGAIMTRSGSCYRCMSCGGTSGCS
jgi:ribonucleoside-diphosphate reductase alpha chain